MTLTFITISIALTLLAHRATAATYPTTKAALSWRPLSWWLRQAACIHEHESAGLGWHLNHVDWRGRWSPYAGGLQFLDSTWHRAGGTGSAHQWSEREQQYRAFVIWDKQNGRLGDGIGDWSEWGTARACGLR